MHLVEIARDGCIVVICTGVQIGCIAGNESVPVNCSVTVRPSARTRASQVSPESPGYCRGSNAASATTAACRGAHAAMTRATTLVVAIRAAPFMGIRLESVVPGDQGPLGANIARGTHWAIGGGLAACPRRRRALSYAA